MYFTYRSFQYDRIWTELPTLTQNWKQILVPTYCVFSQGVSQRIYSIIPKRKRKLIQSPIIFLKARKNPVEIENMKIAHIRDAAAMCMFFSYFEQKVNLIGKYKCGCLMRASGRGHENLYYNIKLILLINVILLFKKNKN